MLLYNFGVAVVLGVAGALSQTIGVALWPAVALHVGMAAWCVTFLARKPSRLADVL
jgi:EamA domain-containing membrane protein RarD